MNTTQKRALLLGRSSPVLLDAVKILRDSGLAANASNQFGTVLHDYDMCEVDLVVFGGMVQPDVQQRLESEIRQRNPRIQFMQGLGPIAPLIAAQVEEFFIGRIDDVQFDADTRTARVHLTRRAHVLMHMFWVTFTSSVPVRHDVVACDGELGAGGHTLMIPDGVPLAGSFAVTRIEGQVSVTKIGDRHPHSGSDDR